MTIHMRETDPGFERRASGLIVPPNRELVAQLRGEGRYTGRIIRDGKVIDEFDAKNLVVAQGLNYMLGATRWLAAPSLPPGTSACSAATTRCWTPISPPASPPTRPRSRPTPPALGKAWTPNSSTVTGKSIQQLQLAGVSFTFNGSVTVYGAFLDLFGDDQRHWRHAVLRRSVLGDRSPLSRVTHPPAQLHLHRRLGVRLQKAARSTCATSSRCSCRGCRSSRWGCLCVGSSAYCCKCP